jgi:hypothetical protein
VGVERLAVRDREDPRTQIRARPEPWVGSQRGDEGLLKAVLCLAGSDACHQEAPDGLALGIEKALERWGRGTQDTN